MKQFAGKARQSVLNCLKSKSITARVLNNGFKASVRSKTNILNTGKRHPSLFADLWVMKFKPFSGKVRQSISNYLNLKLIIGRTLEEDLQATSSSKTNVLSVFFYKFLSDEFETVLRKSKVKRSKPFKSEVGFRKHSRKWFSSYLEVKNECSEFFI